MSTVDGSEKYQAPNRVELVQDTNLRQNIKEAIEKAFKSYSNPEKLNTVLPHLMTFTRHLEAFSKTEGVTLEDLRIGCYLLGQLMHPMAPHTSGFICRRLLDDADPIFAWPALRSN